MWFHMPQDTRMAISPQQLIRYTSCLVLGRVFRVGGSNGAISDYIKSKLASWIISSVYISATAHSIHLHVYIASRGHLCDSTAFLLVLEIGRGTDVQERSQENAEVLREMEWRDGDKNPVYMQKCFRKGIANVYLVCPLMSLSWQQIIRYDMTFHGYNGHNGEPIG